MAQITTATTISPMVVAVSSQNSLPSSPQTASSAARLRPIRRLRMSIPTTTTIPHTRTQDISVISHHGWYSGPVDEVAEEEGERPLDDVEHRPEVGDGPRHHLLDPEPERYLPLVEDGVVPEPGVLPGSRLGEDGGHRSCAHRYVSRSKPSMSCSTLPISFMMWRGSRLPMSWPLWLVTAMGSPLPAAA